VYPATPLIPTEEDILNRFGLTRKEAAVTRLLADGKQNDAIAAALFISPHTARRHTESVMRKLGVASRAEIGPLLLRLDCDVPEQRRTAAPTLPRIEERSLSRAVAMRTLTNR
jgi:DNA-binding CsgD family transcriptional regulator